MKAINPNTHKLEPCTLLKNWVVEGRDWVRFDDGRMEPLANVDGFDMSYDEYKNANIPDFKLDCNPVDAHSAFMHFLSAMEEKPDSCPRIGMCECDGKCGTWVKGND